MRFLIILIVTFGMVLFSVGFAQSEPIEPKFGIGTSLGVSTSLHVIARNIGVQGLGLRADVGGFAFFFGWTQLAVNIEYHLFTAEPVGFYFGAGFIGIKISGFEPSPPGNEYPWMFGVQAYAGLDL